jgi:hypothetical protein
MTDTLRILVRGRLIACITFLCCLAVPRIGSATPKQYPIEGTVIGLGTKHDRTVGLTAFTVHTP